MAYILRRFVAMAVTIALVSVVAFILIQLPPGDYISSYVAAREAAGDDEVSQGEIDSMVREFGLDKPVHMQYLRWIGRIVTKGDFGRSFAYRRSINELIWERFVLTAVVGLSALVITYLVGVPLGIYSSLRQYSVSDFALTTVGYVGLATPNFLLAILLMYLGFKYFGASVGGLFDSKYMESPWTLAKIVNMLGHLWVPAIVLGTAGTAGIIRVTRGMMLDELRKQYVVTARAKGLRERSLIFKYPVRIALNPIVATIGWQLTAIVSGAPIVAMVLSLPTTGPLMINALLLQDMYLAGTFILLLCTFTVVGTFISDVLLAMIDPRIRLGAERDGG